MHGCHSDAPCDAMMADELYAAGYGADVVVLSEDPTLVAQARRLLSGDSVLVRAVSPTTLDRVDETGFPDAIIIDARCAANPARMLRMIRRRWRTTPIMVAEAATDAAVMEWLNVGAVSGLATRSDVRMQQAVWGAFARHARIERVERRIVFGDLVYDRDSHRVWCAGRDARLTGRELVVFQGLFARAGATVSRDTLIDFIWHGAAPKASANALEVYIGYLRRKLRGSRQVVIETMRGRGYRLRATAGASHTQHEYK